MKVILQVLEHNTDGITSFSFFSSEDQSQGLSYAGNVPYH